MRGTTAGTKRIAGPALKLCFLAGLGLLCAAGPLARQAERRLSSNRATYVAKSADQVATGRTAQAASRDDPSGKSGIGAIAQLPGTLPPPTRPAGGAKKAGPIGPVVDPNASVAEADLKRVRAGLAATFQGRRVHKLGLLPSSSKPGIYRGKPARPLLRPLDALPTAVDHSAALPPVGDQGIQGSCGPWSVGYYYKSFQEQNEHGWDVRTPDHQFSPSFLYNQVAPFDEGTTFDELFNLLLDQGCGTLSDWPYNETDYTTWPPYNAFLNGLPYRIQTYTRLGDRVTPGIINAMKSRLAAGDLCVIGFPVYRPTPSTPGLFDILDAENYFYEMPGDDDVYNAGGHAVTVVGYDDAVFDGRGGFKIVNSWDSTWGSRGFAYMSYQFISALVFDVYAMADRIGYQPTAVASFALQHTWWQWNYDNVTVSIGVGPTDAPLWSKVFITGLERSSLAVDMAVDITEGDMWLPPGWEEDGDYRWWIEVQDHAAEDVGNLTVFEIGFDGGTYSCAVVLPIVGPFPRGTVYAYIPPGDAASPNYYVNDDSTAGDRYCTAPGNDANDGLSPATPKRNVQPIIDCYTLKAGDTVWMDTGTYNLSADITLNYLDKGVSGNPIRFVGAIGLNGEPSTVLDRGAGGGVSFNITDGTRSVQLENLQIRGGDSGVRCNGAWDYQDKGLTFQNVDISNTSGYVFDLYRAQGVVLKKCRMHGFGGSSGVYLYQGTVTLHQSVVAAPGGKRCVLVKGSGSYYGTSAHLTLTNSILTASGSGGECVRLVLANYGYLSAGRFNDLFATDGAVIGFTPDGTNISVDPLFFDPDNGDFHLKSSAGRWDPSAGGGAGDWVTTDAENSPCIDAGDISAHVGDESSPNGGRINMGTYGGTQWASKSPPARHIAVVRPNGGETWTGVHEVAWETWGAGWVDADMVTLEYWDGTDWHLLNAGSDSLPCNVGSREWNVNGPGITPGPGFKVRVTANADAAVFDESDGEFTIEAGGTSHYVNDGSTVNDVYCTAPGNDANDGLTPSTPKASIQAIIDTYDLEPGDTVYVDTGYYTLTADVEVGIQDSGTASGWVRFVGSPHPDGTTLDRSSTSSNVRCWYLNGCNYVTVEGFACTGATWGYGIESYGSAWCILDGNECYGNKDGIYVHAGRENSVVHCILHDNDYYGINSHMRGVVRNNTCYGNGIAGLYAGSGTYRNNILVADGTGKFCLAVPSGSSHHLDYNDYWTENGASVCNHGGRSRTLGAWQSTTGRDTHSLLRDPEFVDPGAGDFHLGPNSPSIDAGDGADSVGEEPAPNGGRINMGAYGGTSDATISFSGRLLSLLSLTGGGIYSGTQEVRWLAAGQVWSAGDTVAIEYSDDSGQDWRDISGALDLPYTAGTFSWDTATLPWGTQYRISVTCNEDGTVRDESRWDFTIRHEPVDYYVNDDSTVNDVYCMDVGDDANDGATPATPKASIQAILDAYDLEPGDTVYVDTGYYTLATDIEVGSQDSGSASAPLRFVGSTHPDGTTVDRNSASTIARCWYLNGCSYVTVESFRCTGATNGSGIASLSATSCTFERNECYGNRDGMYIHGTDVIAQHCVVRGNSRYGIYSPGSFVYPLVRNNTFYDNGMGGVYANTGTYRNNILMADGSGKHCLEIGSAGSLNSDYNVFRAVTGASVFKQGGTSKTLWEWQSATRQDLHSVLADPLFADADNGDFHLKSETGRFVPGSGWVTDSETSPCIDLGHPADSVGYEEAPNGGRVNLGAYGGTAEASGSAPGRILVLATPYGGETWSGVCPVRWFTAGQGWSAGDKVTLEYSADSGDTWVGIEMNGVPYQLGEFAWDTTAVPNCVHHRIRVAYKDDPAVHGESESDFAISNRGHDYYVNDDSTVNDVYCTDVGDDANDGATPATPKASIQAILDAYDLEPGDTVYVDTGYYTLATDIVVGSQDSGSASAPLRFVGSTHPDGTTVDRNSASSIATCWYLYGCSYVTVEGFRCTGATKGRGIYGSGVTSCTLDRNECYGNTYGMYIGSGVTVQHCILRGNSAHGIYSPGSFAYPLVRNNTCYGNGSAGVYAVTGTYRNNILVADGSGKHCLEIGSAGSLNSDYNVFRAVNGASVFKQGTTSKTLWEWQSATGQDLHSVLADPLFADADNGDFHLKSETGRFVPGSGWVTDSETSPCIDLGHPADSVADEQSPNGGRVNLGAYGGTAEASQSRTTKALRLVAPKGGEVWAEERPVRWLAEGVGWDPNSDGVTIALSDDGGMTWEDLVGRPGVGAGAPEWWWDTTTVPNGTSYRVRATSGSYSDSSDADFTIDNAPAAAYYVNDDSTLNDVYCTGVGNDANDGLSPATPKATIQAVLDAYDLGQDSIVFVDTGTYLLDTAITITSNDTGVGLVGAGTCPPTLTVLDRQVPDRSSGSCILMSPDCKTAIKQFVFRNANNGVAFAGYGDRAAQILNNRMEGCGIELQSYSVSSAWPITIHGNTCSSIDLTGGTCTITNNSVYPGSLVLRNIHSSSKLRHNIVWTHGAGQACIYWRLAGSLAAFEGFSDYNLLRATAGAITARVTASGGFDAAFATLPEWRSFIGADAHSISASPGFANPLAWDFHLESAAGRYDPTTGLPPTDPSAWVTDSNTSLAIDAGRPTDSVGTETPPTGGRLNLGAFGGTGEASRSVTAPRIVEILTPDGAEVWTNTQAIELRTSGSAWQAGDTLRLEYSPDAGATWQDIESADAVACNQSRFWWDTRDVPNGYGYLVRVTCVQDEAVQDVSDGYFAVGNDTGGAWSLYVATTGVDDELYGIAAQPFRTVGHALGVAEGTEGAPVDIHVAAGTYVERVAMDPWVNLLGGYSAAHWSRDIAVNETILDGSAGGSVVTGADNALIEGFTITNGSATSGGGIFCDRTSPTIRHNRIRDNVATGAGGGISCYSSWPTISNNVIGHNSAKDGGGIRCYLSPAIIDGNTIANNLASACGGGLYLAYGAPIISNTVIAFNSASANGGGVRCSSSSPSITYCDVYGNTPDKYYGIPDPTGTNGNVSVDPLFAEADNADYHLKSTIGRWDPGAGAWVTDTEYSPSIDAGDESSDYSNELEPNGDRINMGAYGNTAQASKSDEVAPEVLSATYVDDIHVDVEFGEQVDRTTTQEVGNYSIEQPHLDVTAAVLDVDNKTAHLTVGQQAEDTTYTVTVSSVEDLAGNRIVSGSGDTAQWRMPQATHELAATGYYMISFPLTPISATVHDLLCDDLGDGNYYMWWWWAGGYQTVPTAQPECEYTTLGLQRGYWLLAAAATLDIWGTPPSWDQTIPLKTGWNMIAAPFEATMDSLQVDKDGDVRGLADAQAAGWVLATFYYSHDGTGSYSRITIGQDPPDTLSLWYGYWVLAGLECSLIVPAPAGGSVATALQHDSVPPVWAFDIEVIGGESADRITVAAADSASDDFDGFGLDQPKPPAPPGEGRLRMVLRAEGWRGTEPPPYNKAPGRQMPWASQLATETKSSAQDVLEWNFTITGGREGEPVRLTWPDLSRLPKDRVAILTDRDSGARTSMRSRAQYEFEAPSSGASRSFTVSVKPAQQGALLISGLSAVPTRGGTWDIGFSLSADATVTARVYNVAGRLVGDIANGSALARGRASLPWNGRGVTDTHVPSGTYLLRVTARTEDGEQASAVTLMQVRR